MSKTGGCTTKFEKPGTSSGPVCVMWVKRGVWETLGFCRFETSLVTAVSRGIIRFSKHWLSSLKFEDRKSSGAVKAFPGDKQSDIEAGWSWGVEQGKKRSYACGTPGCGSE